MISVDLLHTGLIDLIAIFSSFIKSELINFCRFTAGLSASRVVGAGLGCLGRVCPTLYYQYKFFGRCGTYPAWAAQASVRLPPTLEVDKPGSWPDGSSLWFKHTEKLEFLNSNHSHGETLNRFPLWSQPPPFRSSPCCHGNNCSYRRCVVGHSGLKYGKLVQ